MHPPSNKWISARGRCWGIQHAYIRVGKGTHHALGQTGFSHSGHQNCPNTHQQHCSNHESRTYSSPGTFPLSSARSTHHYGIWSQHSPQSYAFLSNGQGQNWQHQGGVERERGRQHCRPYTVCGRERLSLGCYPISPPLPSYSA